MWVVISILATAITASLLFWMSKRGIKMSWYEILIIVIGAALILASAQNYVGFKAEFEPKAATQSLLVLGGPAVLLLAIAGSLIWRRNRKEVST
jgi:hypothetical protein